MSEFAEGDHKSRVDGMTEKLIGMLKKRSGKENGEWSSSTTLEDAGLDSFDVVECIFEIEEELGVSIDFNANNESKISTIGEFAEVIVKNMKKAVHPAAKVEAAS